MYKFRFSYKSLLLITGFITIIQTSNAQCISGDCENGIGEMQLANGIYKGAFKNREPHGDGIFYGKRYATNTRVDSIMDEGVFRYGIFLKGKRHIIKSWDEVEVPSAWFANKAGTKVGNKYRFEDGSYNQDAGKFWMYPIELTFDVTETSPKGKKKSWKEKGLRFDQGEYRGDIKNGLPNGNGKFSNYNIEFHGTFEDGTPTAQSDETINYVDRGSKRVVSMQIENGMITNMVIRNNDTSRIFKLLKPKSAFDFLFAADYDGYYEVTNRFGDKYTGMVNKWQYDGSGEIIYKGGKYKGYFVQNKFHGIGVRETAASIDSGLYIRHELKTGFVTLKKDSKQYKYPVCLSGDCENGFGKISYLINSTDNEYRTYEGNLVQSMPNGYGIFKEKKGDKIITISGNYVQGMLNGNATYEGNAGIVTKMTGTFRDDTLKAGTINYNDGTAYEFNKDIVPPNANRNTFNIFTTTVSTKHISGYGKYFTPGGALVEGDFYVDGGRLFDGIYTDKEGNRIRMGWNVNGDPVEYRDLDAWAKQYIARIKADDEAKRRAAAEYAAQINRQEQYAIAAKNPANFTEGYETVTCSACSGKGYIISGYAVGSTSYVSQEYMDNSGNWRRDLKAFVPAHNVTSRTPCEACHKRGTVTIKTKKYIGPKY